VHILSFVANARDLCSLSMVPITSSHPSELGSPDPNLFCLLFNIETDMPSAGHSEPGRRLVEAARPPILGRSPYHQVS
jgi:hypothetical protein